MDSSIYQELQERGALGTSVGARWPLAVVAGGRFPTRGVGLFAEMRAGDHGAEQVRRIGDDGLHNDPVGLGLLDHVVEFLNRGFVTIGNSVAAKIAWSEVTGVHFERAALAGIESRSEITDTTKRSVPLSRRITLQGGRAARG